MSFTVKFVTATDWVFSDPETVDVIFVLLNVWITDPQEKRGKM